MREKVANIIQFCQNILISQKQPRDDYKESIELVLVVLGSTPAKFTFKKPGAFHKARWMAPLIYGLKIFLLRKVLHKNQSEIKKLERFATFVCLYYIEYWLNTPLASEAPYMDLKLHRGMLEYLDHDPDVADAVLKKFDGHTWYLNQIYVPLSLFSCNVSDDEKIVIAQKLKKVRPLRNYSAGHPSCVELSRDYQLSDSVMAQSLFMFHVTKLKYEWLNRPVHEWKNYDSFLEMESFVKNLKVTNDTAERGVKLVSDYANSLTKNSVEREDLLQVVEQHRRLMPGCSKATLSKGLNTNK